MAYRRTKRALASASDWSAQLPRAAPNTYLPQRDPASLHQAVGMASGLLTLATFAFQSSITLIQTIRSFQSHAKRASDLIEELEALKGVLGLLTETVSLITDVDLSALEVPLRRCGNSCKEFEQEVLKCSSRSGGGRTSFRDWAKLRYMGEDIDGFRRLLAGYKLTINVALTDANLRKSSNTAESLESYKDLIKTATDNLEAHLESIDEKLEMIFERTVPESDSDAAERRLIKEEQLSTQKCLQICAQLSEHINQIQLTSKRRGGSPGTSDPDPFPEIITNVGLQECTNSLILTVAKLEGHMQDLMDRMVRKSKTAMTSEDDVADLERLRDQWTAARQCMDICSKADNHLQQNISTIENYAIGDAVQFMVSTDGRTIHGKNRGLGWRTRQVGGHLSNDAVRQLSRDMTSVGIRNTESEAPPSRGDTQSVPNDAAEDEPVTDFRGRYGRGFKLTSKSVPDVTRPPTKPAENGQNNSPQS